MRGILVLGRNAFGFLIQRAIHSGVVLEVMRVRGGPIFRRPVKPRILWQPWQP